MATLLPVNQIFVLNRAIWLEERPSGRVLILPAGVWVSVEAALPDRLREGKKEENVCILQTTHLLYIRHISLFVACIVNMNWNMYKLTYFDVQIITLSICKYSAIVKKKNSMGYKMECSTAWLYKFIFITILK